METSTMQHVCEDCAQVFDDLDLYLDHIHDCCVIVNMEDEHSPER